MIIGDDFVFLCIPRCASNTMREWLQQFGGVSVEPHHGNIIPPEHLHKFTFAIVRNPYDRMLSCWYHNKRCSPEQVWRDMDAVTFARRCSQLEYGMSQATFLRDIRIDQLVPYESLNIWPFWLGLAANPWGHPPTYRMNAEPRPRWTIDPNLTSEFIDAVHGHSWADFRCYGYERLDLS